MRAQVQSVDMGWPSKGNGIKAYSFVGNLEETEHHLKVFAIFTIDLYHASLYCFCVEIMKPTHKMMNERDY
jgi:hypothetical protein